MTIITHYNIRLAGDSATVTLESDATPNMMGGRRVARIKFARDLDPHAVINRGGFLSMRHPIELLGPFLALLQHEAPLNLDESGVLSTGTEPIVDDDPDDVRSREPGWTNWVRWRQWLLVSNPGGVGLLGSAERCFVLGGWDVAAPGDGASAVGHPCACEQ